MSAALIGAVGTIVSGLLALLGVRWMANVQKRTAANEERLTQYESWKDLIDQHQRDSDRYRVQRDEAWTANDRLRAENALLRRRVEDWLMRE